MRNSLFSIFAVLASIGCGMFLFLRGPCCSSPPSSEQNEEEIQLPGGGIDEGEHYITALVRETFEETGWKIQPVKRLGFFHRFVYMPEYSKWAQKVCHIYICKGLYNLTSPL